MGFEAIVLAGGLGTRIRTVVADTPKVMVDVGGRPFLEILLANVRRHGVGRVILATGYLHSIIQAHFGNRWKGLEIEYSVEDKPLGTGGAILRALQRAGDENVFVLNGDTFFDVDLRQLHDFHAAAGADVTLALKPMRDFARYGAVKTDGSRVTGFCEKGPTREGLINGGVYVIRRSLLARLRMPEKFSFETDFLEKMEDEINLGGFVAEGYFIDIGVPDDYVRAQRELPSRIGELDTTMKNESWTKELPCAITVVDAEGTILDMNDKSAATFAADGGRALIGSNVLDCHPEPSRTKLHDLMTGTKSNIYTIEKAGVRKMICQIPWYRAGEFAGMVELSIELPAEIPHFIRD